MSWHIRGICATAILLLALVVTVGWAYDQHGLTSIVDGFVTMKFATAMGFLGAGAALLARKHAMWSFAGTTWCFCWSSLALLSALGIVPALQIGKLEDLPYYTVAPHVPSLGTLFCFFVFSIKWMATLFGSTTMLRIGGAAVAGTGALGLLGYALGLPLMYFSIEGISTAMAVHTCVGFLLLGVGMLAETWISQTEK